MTRNDPEYWIKRLDLIEHPEGGFYRETYRTRKKVEKRNLATNIFYLLPFHTPSKFHRLKYDEYWYYHFGSPMKMYFFTPQGRYEEHVLGNDPDEGHELSLLVPGGTIFGGEVTEPEGFILVSCNMSPGFHFEDFEMFSKEELLKWYPSHKEIINKLC